MQELTVIHIMAEFLFICPEYITFEPVTCGQVPGWRAPVRSSNRPPSTGNTVKKEELKQDRR